MNNNQNIHDNFISRKKANNANTSVYLINGIHLQGVIEDFDQNVIFLKSHTTQMIYKHAIATIN